jgi:hypothetical protein
MRSSTTAGSVVTAMFPAAALKPLHPDDYLLLCHLILAPVLSLAGCVVARTFAGWPHGQRRSIVRGGRSRSSPKNGGKTAKG